MTSKQHRHRLVVFCGAGFSAPVGIPTMERFADSLRDCGYLADNDLRDFDHVQATCNSLAAVIGGSARNLEQLCSFLSILQLVKPDFEFSGARKDFATPAAALETLKGAMAFVAKPHLLGASLESAGTLFRSVAGETDLTFITTNYDIHIELAALREGYRTHCSPRLKRISGGATVHRDEELHLYAEDDEPAIPIYKLHGSTNWCCGSDGLFVEHLVRGSRWFSAEPGHRRRPSHYSLALYDGDQGHKQAESRCRQFSRLIVPPTVIKPSLLSESPDALGALLREQWVGAANAIARADRLWFIGYSFPETDSFMRFFLGASLFQNTHIRQIVVIDPNVDTIVQRAQPLFAAPHHREVFRGLPFYWQEVVPGAILAGHLRQQADRHLDRLAEIGLTPLDIERGNLIGRRR